MASRHPEGQRKANRLNLIVNLLWKRPLGLTSEDLSRELHVTQRTVQRDLEDLQDDSYRVPLQRQGVRWTLLTDKHPLLSALHLTLAEATALLLAARLLQRASDETNPHVTGALAKLAAVLPENLAQHLRGLNSVGARPDGQVFATTFEVLALAWAKRQTVHLCYQPANATDLLETDFDVYCLEPIAPSFAIYAIGFAHARREIRTLKLERVLSAQPTAMGFQIDSSFNAQSYLLSGWGIMGGREVQTVRLRLAPEAVQRLHESQFHPSQRSFDEPDGSCIVTFDVAHPIEVAAFVRGWGPRVEVLEPAELRELIAREARETARLYERLLPD